MLKTSKHTKIADLKTKAKDFALHIIADLLLSQSQNFIFQGYCYNYYNNIFQQYSYVCVIKILGKLYLCLQIPTPIAYKI